MSRSKKAREEAKRRLNRALPTRQRRREPNAPSNGGVVVPDIHREIRYITQLAQAEDSRIVTLGNLVLFSTSTRDAWLLDLEDDFALCLCREGEPQPYRVVDTPERFGIEWTAHFTIEGAQFIVRERSGRVIVIDGYPTVEISAARRR
jgi:hypothetical protein